MGRIVRVEDRPRLSGTLTDHRVVRADGTGAVQGSNWTIDDGVTLTGEGIAQILGTTSLTLSSGAGEVGLGVSGATIFAVDASVFVAEQVVRLDPAGGSVEIAPYGGTTTITGNTTISGDDGASISVGPSSQVAITVPSENLLISAVDYSVSNASAFRAAIGLGAPIHRAKSGATQNFTSDALVTFGTSVTTSGDVSYTADEFIINTDGTYRIDVTCRHLSSGGVAGDTVLDLWIEDDSASQGTNVETAGTRVSATVTNSPEAATMATHAIIPGLVAGDTIRVVAGRKSGGDTVGISHGRVTVQRIG